MMRDQSQHPYPWRKVVSRQRDKNDLRWLMTLECGHTVDAYHQDEEIRCMACGGCKSDDHYNIAGETK